MRQLSVAEQRYQAVLAVIGEGRTVTEVAEQWQVDRSTLHRWLARYELEGLNGLGDRPHRPESCPHQMSAVVEAMVLELRRQRPYWGPRNLVLQLAKKPVVPLPSESAIYRCLVRAGVVEPPAATREGSTGSAGSEADLWSSGSWTFSTASPSPTEPRPRH